jgi:hypothetical protein
MAPGPELARVLADLEPDAVAAGDVMVVAAAWYRQLAHDRGRFLTWVAESGLRRPDVHGQVARVDTPDEFAADEIRAALVLTHAAAALEFDRAYALRTRLPLVHQAMLAGSCDEPRARVFITWTAQLCQAHVDEICAALVPLASGLTVPQLIDRIRRRALALDPGWVQRRYDKARSERGVIGTRDPDGTASVTGYGLDLADGAAICGRLDALARSAKNDGDRRPIDHLRVDIYAGLLMGTYEGMTDREILDHLARTRLTAAPAPMAPLEPTRAGVELQVRVSTLLGLDEFPADLAGWGPIHPALARALAADLGTGQWRYALTGVDGRLLTQGLTPARPTGTALRHWRSRAIVELQIPAALLLELGSGALATHHSADPARVRAWAPVLADIVRRLGGIDALAGRRPYPPPDDGTDDPTRRFARAGLRRDVQMRKRRCMGVGCRAPVARLDLDHTRDHALGGPTTGANLWPGCKHDHALKTKGGWRVRAIDADTLRWTSRLGATYVVQTPPVIDPDLPVPDPDPDTAEEYAPDRAPAEQVPQRTDPGSWYEPPPPGPRRHYVDVEGEPPPRPAPPPLADPDVPPF